MIKKAINKKSIIIISIFILFLIMIPFSFAADFSDNSTSTSRSNFIANDELSTVQSDNTIYSIDSSNNGIFVDSSNQSANNRNLNSNNVDKLNSGSDSISNYANSVSELNEGQIQTNMSNTDYTNIKSALSAVSSENTTIFIGPGIYNKTNSGSHSLVSGEQNTNISISKASNLTIIGAGQDKTFIDGTKTDWLFNISSSNVTFINLTFINAYASTASVIFSSSSNLSMRGCKVENNTVNGKGYNSYSPIYFIGSSFSLIYVLNISDSNFNNNRFVNSGLASGGAICVSGAILDLFNSSFENNSCNTTSSSAYNGGAIYLKTNGLSYIDNCKFLNNSAKKGGSIASYWGGNLTVTNSNFTNSKADINGAAIYGDDSTKVVLSLGNNIYTNCKLANGTEENFYVTGANLVDTSDNAVLSANDTYINFGNDKNYTILFMDKSNNPISNKELEINLTSSNSSTIFKLITNSSGITSLNLKDIAVGLYNATVSFKTDETYTASSIKNKIAISANYDFALIMNPLNITLTEGQAFNVTGTVVDNYNEITNSLNFYAVYINWLINGHKHSLTGYQINGSTIIFDLGNLRLVSSSEIYNLSFEIQDEYASIEPGIVHVNLRTNAPSIKDLDVIYVDSVHGNDSTGNASVENPVASLQVALDINTILGGNKTIILKSGNYNISGYTIKNDVTVIGENPLNTIISQLSGKNGMFFLAKGINAKFDNLSFTNGYATPIPYGAVFTNNYNANLTLTNSRFYKNTGWYGGVINNDDNGTVKIENCSFFNNTAQNGAAIWAYNGFLNIFNSNFTDNIAKVAGALSLYNNVSTTIFNCNFINNTATESQIRGGGGAIMTVGPNPTIINNSKFINNTAIKEGGAIYVDRGNVTVFACEFINNTAGSGSIIYSGSYNNIINLTNSVLLNNNTQHSVISSAYTVSNITVDNNWWGTNKVPSYYLYNVNLNSWIIMTFTNYYDTLYVSLNQVKNTEGKYSALPNGYLPSRKVIFSPDLKINPSITLTDANSKANASYISNITGDSLTATVDNQVLSLKFYNSSDVTTFITVDDISAINGSNINLTAHVYSVGPNITKGNVTFFIDGINIGTANVINGTASLNYFVDGKLAKVNVTAFYNGFEGFGISNGTGILIVESNNQTTNGTNQTNQTNQTGGTGGASGTGGTGGNSGTGENKQIITKLLVNNLVMVYGDNENFTATLTDVNSHPLFNKTLVLTLTNSLGESKNYTVITNISGVAILPINLIAGNYTISGIFAGDSKYTSSNFTNLSLIVKVNTNSTNSTNTTNSNNTNSTISTILTASNSTFITKSGENYTVSLKDTNGNPIVGQEIAIKLTNALGQSVIYWATTNIKGIAKLQINLAWSGVYNIEASYGGKANYTGSTSKGIITIVNSVNSTVLTANNMNTSCLSGENFTVRLYDANAHILSGKKVSLTLVNALGQNKTYWSNTNSTGYAKLSINLEYPSTYHIIANFPGDKNIKSSNTVDATIIISALTN